MKHARALLPYALASALVVVASGSLIALALGPASGTAAPVSPRAGTAQTLSSEARLAYWREAADARWQLWVSDLDGLRRWTIAADRIGLMSLTRWRPDGQAVAYVRDRNALVIAPLIGTAQVIGLPGDLVQEGYGIVGYHWSGDGQRIALSLRDARGASREGDVWVVDVGPRSWWRVTETGDALAGPWIDDDELLIESTSGFVGLARLGQRIELRPVTGMTAVSPQIGRDGRLYVAGGGGGVGQQFGPLPHAQGGIWSMALDGSDVRRERGDQASEFRLLGRWIDDRFVVSRAGSAEIIGDPGLTLPWSAGNIRTVEPLGERQVLAFTENRVLSLDPRLITPTTGLYTPSPGLTVLLDRVYDPVLWRPRSPVEPLRTAGRHEPTPRSAFVTGKLLWLVEDGDAPRLILTARADQWMGRPEWSPDGTMLAVTLAGSDRESDGMLILDRAGQVLHRMKGRGGRPTWSPDSRSIARDVWTETPAKIHIHDLDRPGATQRIEGSAVTWTTRGLLVAVMTFDARGVPIRQRIDVVTGAERRTVVDSIALAAHPRLSAIGKPSEPLSLFYGGFSAPRDGTYLAVGVSRGGTTLAQGVVVVRLADAEVVTAIPSDRHGGFWPEWSPRGDLFARDAGPFPASNAEDLGRGPSVITEILDPVTGKVVASAPGRFAGWTGDGEHVYVARPEGLFRHALSGGDGVLVSPFGVPFSIAPR